MKKLLTILTLSVLGGYAIASDQVFDQLATGSASLVNDRTSYSYGSMAQYPGNAILGRTSFSNKSIYYDLYTEFNYSGIVLEENMKMSSVSISLTASINDQQGMSNLGFTLEMYAYDNNGSSSIISTSNLKNLAGFGDVDYAFVALTDLNYNYDNASGTLVLDTSDSVVLAAIETGKSIVFRITPKYSGLETDKNYYSNSYTYGAPSNPDAIINSTVTFTPIPEPAACALMLGVAFLGFAILRRRK